MGRDKDKEKEGKQKRISRSSCSLPADWCITELVPEQQQPTPWPVPLVLLFSITPYVVEYPFGQSGSAVQVLSLPSSLCTFSPLTGGSTRSWNVVNSVQHCSTTTETSLCCQHYSHPKSKTWCHTSHCKENQLYSSQNQDSSDSWRSRSRVLLESWCRSTPENAVSNFWLVSTSISSCWYHKVGLCHQILTSLLIYYARNIHTE